jgi:hypothetical protein
MCRYLNMTIFSGNNSRVIREDCLKLHLSLNSYSFLFSCKMIGYYDTAQYLDEGATKRCF